MHAGDPHGEHHVEGAAAVDIGTQLLNLHTIGAHARVYCSERSSDKKGWVCEIHFDKIPRHPGRAMIEQIFGPNVEIVGMPEAEGDDDKAEEDDADETHVIDITVWDVDPSRAVARAAASFNAAYAASITALNG